jgi:polyisoprenoid-binding protein YceI
VPRFRIDPDESRVWIEARSSLHPVHSETTGLRGSLELTFDAEGRLDAGSPSSGHVELDAETLSTGNGLYDREMRRRIDVRRHPTIAGELRAMKETQTPGRYRVEGEVTFRGVCRTAADEMVITADGDGAVRLEGEHTFDIRDFTMEPPKLLALRVYPEVAVRVALVARPEPSAFSGHADPAEAR